MANVATLERAGNRRAVGGRGCRRSSTRPAPSRGTRRGGGGPGGGPQPSPRVADSPGGGPRRRWRAAPSSRLPALSPGLPGRREAARGCSRRAPQLPEEQAQQEQQQQEQEQEQRQVEEQVELPLHAARGAARLPADRSVPVPVPVAAEPPPLRQERGTGAEGPRSPSCLHPPPLRHLPLGQPRRQEGTGARGDACGGHRGCTAPVLRAGARCPCSLGTGPLSQKRCSKTTCHQQEKLLGWLTPSLSLPSRLKCPHVYPSPLPPHSAFHTPVHQHRPNTSQLQRYQKMSLLEDV